MHLIDNPGQLLFRCSMRSESVGITDTQLGVCWYWFLIRLAGYRSQEEISFGSDKRIFVKWN